VSVGGEVATLEVTADHPFWSPTQRAFVRVMNLEVGARLETRSGGTAIVVGKTWRPSAVTVYNLEVAGLHHYVVHVGDDDAVVVHNGWCSKLTDLPSLDSTGKVHGDLPKPQDLKGYAAEDLVRFRDDLARSVEERIRKNIELGPQGGHGRRQGEEQDLIASIDKLLEDR